MRCKACNIELTDFEATLRCANTGEFVDVCVACLNAADDENYNGRGDLRSIADVVEIPEDEEVYFYEPDE